MTVLSERRYLHHAQSWNSTPDFSGYMKAYRLHYSSRREWRLHSFSKSRGRAILNIVHFARIEKVCANAPTCTHRYVNASAERYHDHSLLHFNAPISRKSTVCARMCGGPIILGKYIVNVLASEDKFIIINYWLVQWDSLLLITTSWSENGKQLEHIVVQNNSSWSSPKAPISCFTI